MRIFNRKGLTIAEAVISMMLLAIVTMGIYGVIMASVRSGRKPDMREDMANAIQTAASKLRGFLENPVNCVQWKVGCTGPCNTGVADGCPCCLYWDGGAGGAGGCGGKQDVYGDGSVCGVSDWNQAVQQVKTPSNDLCNRPLPNGYARQSTGAQASAYNPFTPGVQYYIDFYNSATKELCLLPPSCDVKTSSFYYMVSYADKDKLRYNIQFHIVCNGQTM